MLTVNTTSSLACPYAIQTAIQADRYTDFTDAYGYVHY